jgi:hypothetical protein
MAVVQIAVVVVITGVVEAAGARTGAARFADVELENVVLANGRLAQRREWIGGEARRKVGAKGSIIVGTSEVEELGVGVGIGGARIVGKWKRSARRG